MAQLFLIILVTAIYITLNIIIGNRIKKSLIISNHKSKILFWFVFMFISLSFLITSFLGNLIPYPIANVLENIGFYYMGLFVYILILFVISFFLTKIFKNGKLDYYSISLVIAIIISIYGFYAAHSTRITNYDVQIDSKIENTDSIKIALISDIHLGYTFGKNHLTKMVNEINDLNPDIIIIAGDLIDSDLDVALKQNSLFELSSLKSKYGTYFVLGNHDCYTGETEKICNILRDNNINVLNDECTLVNNDIYVIGRNDKSISHNQNSNEVNLSERTKLLNIVSGIDRSKPTILIDHSPNDVKEAVENDIDLQVSGHTHNGQLFPFNYIVKNTSPVAYGYDKFNNTNIIVSSGYGTWGPQRRTTGHSEIALINLHN